MLSSLIRHSVGSHLADLHRRTIVFEKLCWTLKLFDGICNVSIRVPILGTRSLYIGNFFTFGVLIGSLKPLTWMFQTIFFQKKWKYHVKIHLPSKKTGLSGNIPQTRGGGGGSDPNPLMFVYQVFLCMPKSSGGAKTWLTKVGKWYLINLNT